MEQAVHQRMAELGQQHWWFEARRRILSSIIRRQVALPENPAILEIGCGPGHNLGMLEKFGRVEACELDEGSRKIASQRLGRPVLPARLPDLSNFQANHYDLVALLDVLEHVDEDRSTLTAIRSLLKPGGTLLLTVPANPWMFGSHDVAHHHKRRYRKKEVASLAAQSGLAVQMLSPFNSFLFPLIAAARLISKISGRDEGDDAMPARPVNAVLCAIFAAEARLLGRVTMPFGVSLVALLRRPAGLLPKH